MFSANQSVNPSNNKELLSIYLLYLVSTITFGIFYSSLSLLLVKQFFLPPIAAMGLLGVFFAFHYTLGIIGGEIGDKYIDFKRLFICGKLFQTLSSLVLILALQNNKLLFFGLALFLTDSMVSTVSLNMFITESFNKNNTQGRLVAFLSSHIWINFGFMIAFLFSGVVYYFFSLDKLLYLTGFFSLITVAASFFIIPRSKRDGSQDTASYVLLKTVLFMTAVSLFLTTILSHFHFSREMIFLCTGLFVLIFMTRSFRTIAKNEVRGIVTFFMFLVCSLGFWSIYMLCPVFLPLFIEHDVNTVFFGLNIPPQWIQMLAPLTAVTVGSLFRRGIHYLMEKKNKQFSRKTYFMLGLGFASLALITLAYGMKLSPNNAQLAYGWVILFIIIMEVAELSLLPASKALVGDLVPERFQGLCTGLNQMSIGISVVFSGLISEIYLTHGDDVAENVLYSYSSYIPVFENLAIASLAIISIMYLFDRVLKRQNI